MPGPLGLDFRLGGPGEAAGRVRQLGWRDGSPVHGPIQLVLTRRRAGLAELTGPGAFNLEKRLAA